MTSNTANTIHCPTHGPIFTGTECTVCRRAVELRSAKQGKLPGLDPGRQERLLRSPLEDVEQELLFDLCRRFSGRYPELGLVFAIPNGMWAKNRGTALKMVRTGLRAGVSDIFCPVPRGAYHGKWIEMKRLRGDGPSAEQTAWMNAMRSLGYEADWHRGGWAAWRSLCGYLGIELAENGLPAGI